MRPEDRRTFCVSKKFVYPIRTGLITAFFYNSLEKGASIYELNASVAFPQKHQVVAGEVISRYLYEFSFCRKHKQVLYDTRRSQEQTPTQMG